MRAMKAACCTQRRSYLLSWEMTADEAGEQVQGWVHRSKSWQSREKTPVNKEPVSFHLTWILYDSVVLGVVLARTFACAFIRLQLHKMRTSTGESLVEVDETQVRARASTVTGGTWVRSCKRKGQSRNVILYILKTFLWKRSCWMLYF